MAELKTISSIPINPQENKALVNTPELKKNRFTKAFNSAKFPQNIKKYYQLIIGFFFVLILIYYIVQLFSNFISRILNPTIAAQQPQPTIGEIFGILTSLQKEIAPISASFAAASNNHDNRPAIHLQHNSTDIS